MATTQAALTPTTQTAPAVISIAAKELSGGHWVSRFPGSKHVSDLRPSFQLAVSDFVWAIEQAGATVKVNATYRPAERAYLMHWSWRIVNESYNAANVPSMAGVLIEWEHPTAELSKKAAKDMVAAYGMSTLKTRPATDSLHIRREAIDMNVSWSGALKINLKDGSETEITSTPRDGMNLHLKEVGATYGVIKFKGGSTDRPHWSTTGR